MHALCSVLTAGGVAHATLAWTAASSQHMLLYWFNTLQLLRVVAEEGLAMCDAAPCAVCCGCCLRSLSVNNSTRQLPGAAATVSLTHTQNLSSSTATCSTAALMAAAAAAATGAGPGAGAGEGPAVHHLRALTDQKPGEHNPVIDWHNRHLQVGHRREQQGRPA